MPRRLRTLFDQIGIIAGLAGAFAGVWIAVTGVYRPPMWVNPVAATGVVALAAVLETVVRAR
ncbi:hypothetical protein ACFQ51_49830 [Streptomyces kaempferi]